MLKQIIKVIKLYLDFELNLFLQNLLLVSRNINLKKKRKIGDTHFT